THLSSDRSTSTRWSCCLSLHDAPPILWALIDNDVEAVIFHRRIKIFFDRRLQPMDLVDEKNVAFFQAREQSRQLARFFDDRPARVFNIHAHRVRDDVGEGGFAEAGWTAQ